MCQIQITSITGVSGGAGGTSVVTVEGTATKCTGAKVEVRCGHNYVSQNIAIPSSGQWSCSLPIYCLCNQDIQVNACCIDANGKVIPGCCNQLSGILICPPTTPKCCPSVQFTGVTISPNCDSECKREVEFFLDLTYPASCTPHPKYRIDWGDGDVDPNSGWYPAMGWTFSHEYHTGPQTITVQFEPSSGCPDVIYNLNIPACDGVQCPVVHSFTTTDKGCMELGGGCCRKIQFALDATFGCAATQLTLDFGDGSSPDVHTGLSGHQSHLWFDHEYCEPGSYPVTLKVPGCPDQVLTTVVIAPCPLAAAVCPAITIVNTVVGECDENNHCQREVELQLLVVNTTGCKLPPKFYIDWGNGDRHPNAPGTISVYPTPSSGITNTYSHNYDAPGSYTIQVIVEEPGGCPIATTTVDIPDCTGSPECPTDIAFTYEIQECSEVGTSCCRTVDFTLAAVFGCGAPTNITVSFGDNSDPKHYSIAPGGAQQFHFDHEYCEPGTFPVLITIPNCPDQAVLVTIPPCTLADPVCPIISIVDAVVSPCDPKNGCKREVELVLKLVNTHPCNALPEFYIEWGDETRDPNSNGFPVYPTQSSGATATYSHSYAPGSYTIQVKVNKPDGCAVVSKSITIEPCDGECAPPCENKGCHRFLCPIFEAMAIAGLGLGILWFILSTCLTLSLAVGAGFLAAGITGLILFEHYCCKECGYRWILLWKLSLGIGILLVCFGACCNLWIWGLVLILLSFVFFYAWKKHCSPGRCDILKALVLMWTTVVVPAVGFILGVSAIANCQLTVFSISVYAIITAIFAVITAYYVKNCIKI